MQHKKRIAKHDELIKALQGYILSGRRELFLLREDFRSTVHEDSIDYFLYADQLSQIHTYTYVGILSQQAVGIVFPAEHENAVLGMQLLPELHSVYFEIRDQQKQIQEQKHEGIEEQGIVLPMLDYTDIVTLDFTSRYYFSGLPISHLSTRREQQDRTYLQFAVGNATVLRLLKHITGEETTVYEEKNPNTFDIYKLLGGEPRVK